MMEKEIAGAKGPYEIRVEIPGRPARARSEYSAGATVNLATLEVLIRMCQYSKSQLNRE